MWPRARPVSARVRHRCRLPGRGQSVGYNRPQPGGNSAGSRPQPICAGLRSNVLCRNGYGAKKMTA
eukprot:7250441-Heterocapsa_arctica.AAC.1